ncbi:hypothetical protein AAFF_G00256590 [Aldrovandia affinis]|uniref:Protein Largen n=1 Tax=Aldrovandia affinis TaxID=143900 RepID=A0AAD7ST20_9TELE|nr:hypothetical protein AAFF_G00256590 [Aldrovandia affinis]
MFSDSGQLGRQRVSQRADAPQRWLHNGAVVQRETGHTGPSSRTDAHLPPPDRRREVGLAAPQEKGNSRGNEANFHGPSHHQRRPLLAEHGARSASVSLSGPRPEPDAAGWNHRAPEQRQRRSSSGREPLRECGCPGHGYQTGPHPSGRKCAPPPAARFKGQESYSAPGYMVEGQFRGSARENYRRGPHECGEAHVGTRGLSRQHGSNNTFLDAREYTSFNNGLRGLMRAKALDERGWHRPSSAQGVIFSTEVPQRELDHRRQRSLCWPGSDVTDVQNKRSSAAQGQRREPVTDGAKMSQATVRDQIRRVVVDLEDVLGGLKQVHLEMKEVVQQIELLTSNIDLGEEEDPSNGFPSDTLCSSSSSGVVVSSRGGVGGREPKRGDPARASLRNTPAHSRSPPPLNPSVVVVNQEVGGSRTCASPPNGPPLPAWPPVGPDRESPGRREGGLSRSTLPTLAFQSQNQPVSVHGPGRTACRSKKPPPYPHNGQIPKTGKGRESQKAPPYPAKRRLLSTVV